MERPVVALVVTYPPHVHGGYNESLSFLQDSLRAVNDAGASPLVVTSDREALVDLRQRGYDTTFLRPTARDRFREALRHAGVDYLRPRERARRWTVEEQLRSMGVRFVMFLSPSWWGGALETLPFSTVVWDVSHRDHPSLAEVRAHGEFVRRERFLLGSLRQAEFIVVPDSHVKETLVKGAYVNDQRVIVRPFRPPTRTNFKTSFTGPVETLVKSDRTFLYYPAYFWPHKGHLPLLQAMALLGSEGPTLVLTAGDRAPDLRELAQRLGVASRVLVLGRISDAESAALYKAAAAVVMPSLFGPSNLPPLEAWAAGTPLVYNVDFQAFARDAAQYMDPLNPSDIASAVAQVLEPIRSRELQDAGAALLHSRDGESDRSVAEISSRVSRILRLT